MRQINVNNFIDRQKFNRFHMTVLLSCIFIIVVDGYDMFMLGTILPSLMLEWNMNAVSAGKIGSYALFGMMVGAMVFGPLADRFGRKNIILICTTIFTLFTFTSGFSNDPSSFGLQRFLAGVGLGLSTLMFGIAAFMSLLVMYGLSTWLPKIMQSSGYPAGSSLLFLITLNLGAVMGAIFGGKLADKFGSRFVLIFFFIFGFFALSSLSLKPNAFFLYTLLFIAGATTTGTQIITNAYVSQYYPSGIRSTGVGWELGIGRIGGILGPTLGGFLLSSQLPLHYNFLAFAIPSIIAGTAIFLVQDKYGQAKRKADKIDYVPEASTL